MSEENKAPSKQDELYEKFKDAEAEVLLKQKMTLVKDLSKNMEQATSTTLDINKAVEVLKELDRVLKQLSTVDVTKGSERRKIAPLLEKVNSLVSSMSLVDQVVAEKAKIVKSLEKVAEVAGSIPVIEKILKEKDF